MALVFSASCWPWNRLPGIATGLAADCLRVCLFSAIKNLGIFGFDELGRPIAGFKGLFGLFNGGDSRRSSFCLGRIRFNFYNRLLYFSLGRFGDRFQFCFRRESLGAAGKGGGFNGYLP